MFGYGYLFLTFVIVFVCLLALVNCWLIAFVIFFVWVVVVVVIIIIITIIIIIIGT